MRYYGTAKRKGTIWTLQIEPHIMILFKRLFPRQKDGYDGKSTVHESPQMAQDLEWFMSRYPLQLSEDDLAYLVRLAERNREQISLVDQLLSGVRIPSDHALAVEPRNYQKVGADLVLARGGSLIADDLGLGKTCTAICVLSHAEARPALVVTQAHLTEQWKEEFQKFTPGLHTHILQKGTPYDFNKSSKKNCPGQLPLFQTAPEVIISSYAKIAGWAGTLEPLVKSVVFDEAQELRRPESRKYTAAKQVSRSASYRMGLTATPIYNYGNEIYNVLDVICPGELGEEHEFQREWAPGGESIKDPKAFGTFAREKGLILRRTAAEVGLELPKIQNIVHSIDSDPEALRNIQSPATELARIILNEGPSARGDKFRASEEFTNMLRQATGISKAPYVAAFVRMLLETGEKVILWGWHHAVYDIWLELLADFHPVMFTGTQSSKQKQDAKRAFIEGNAQLIIMSLRSGAGTDGLQGPCHIGVVGEFDWSPNVHKQCGGRINRPGQRFPCLLYYLAARDGSDPMVIDVLGMKKAQSDGIMDPKDEDIEYLDRTDIDPKKLAEEYLKRHTR